MATKLFCNVCGKEFHPSDEANGANISLELGAGSKYDGCVFDADLCCTCLDKLIDHIAISCEIFPISKCDDATIEALEDHDE